MKDNDLPVEAFLAINDLQMRVEELEKHANWYIFMILLLSFLLLVLTIVTVF